MIVQRPSTRQIFIGNPAVQVVETPKVSAAANWWEAGGASGCIAAYRAKGAASLAASYVNLANPGTYDWVPDVAPTFSAATGWTFANSESMRNGLTTFATTYTVLVQFSNHAGGYLTGHSLTSNYFILNPVNPNDGTVARYWSGTTINVSPQFTSGNIGIAGRNCFRNGVLDGTLSASAATGKLQFCIGGFNFNTEGSVIAKYTGKVQAMAIYNNTLSDATVLAVATEMAAL